MRNENNENTSCLSSEECRKVSCVSAVMLLSFVGGAVGTDFAVSGPYTDTAMRLLMAFLGGSTSAVVGGVVSMGSLFVADRVREKYNLPPKNNEQSLLINPYQNAAPVI